VALGGFDVDVAGVGQRRRSSRLAAVVAGMSDDATATKPSRPVRCGGHSLSWPQSRAVVKGSLQTV
jgi:hypothetical protein